MYLKLHIVRFENEELRIHERDKRDAHEANALLYTVVAGVE